MIKRFLEKQKKKSLFSKITDVFFILLLVGLIIPQTRTPIMVFMKQLTNFSPSVSVDDHYGQLKDIDYQWEFLDDGQQTKSLNDFSKKPILLNLWATWCPPCLAEMPSLLELQKDYGDQVHFIFISQEEQSITHSFLQEKKWRFNSYRPLSREPELIQSSSLPTTFIIDTNGNIIVKETGNKNWNSKRVRELLDEMLRGG